MWNLPDLYLKKSTACALLLKWHEARFREDVPLPSPPPPPPAGLQLDSRNFTSAEDKLRRAFESGLFFWGTTLLNIHSAQPERFTESLLLPPSRAGAGLIRSEPVFETAEVHFSHILTHF